MKEKFFQRISFFKGLFMKAEDWKAEQNYHIMKRKLHSQHLHTPGIVFGCLENLKVTASANGKSLIVSPGYAIDGDGNDIYLPESYKIDLPNLLAFNTPCNIYLSVRYVEKETNYKEDPANKEYSGFTRTTEESEFSVTDQKPDNVINIELARIELLHPPTTVKNPISINAPKPGEIDLTHTRAAGAKTSEKRTKLSLSDIGEKIMDTTIQVSTTSRKQEETSVLIEKIENQENPVPPMYMVHIHSIDNAQIQWWISCCKSNGYSDYSLHLKNNSNWTSTVFCRVFSIRTGEE